MIPLLLSMVPAIIGVVDIVRLPEAGWQNAGKSRVPSIILVIVFGLIGLVIYLLAIRPKVVAAAAVPPPPPAY